MSRPRWQPHSRSRSRSCFKTPWSTLSPSLCTPRARNPGPVAPSPAPGGRRATSGIGARVDLVLDEQPDALQVVVRDNGCGLPEGFDIDRTRSLGLSIVRDLVRSQLGG